MIAGRSVDLIKAASLTKRYPPETGAVENVSFVVNPGEIYVLLGGTRAGKTTVVNIFLGAVAPTGGAATIAGVDVGTRPMDARRLAAFVGPTSALYADMTARQNVEFFARMAGAAVVTRRVVDNAMRRVGIPERCFDRSVRNLGRGRSIGLWLAVGSVRDVKAMILDDPTAGLDPAAATEVRDNLLDVGRGGTALLITSSDVLLAAHTANRVGMLRQGRLVAEQSRPELSHQHLTDFLLEYSVPSNRELWPVSP